MVIVNQPYGRTRRTSSVNLSRKLRKSLNLGHLYPFLAHDPCPVLTLSPETCENLPLSVSAVWYGAVDISASWDGVHRLWVLVRPQNWTEAVLAVTEETKQRFSQQCALPG